jgi:hypothetical protein
LLPTSKAEYGFPTQGPPKGLEPQERRVVGKMTRYDTRLHEEYRNKNGHIRVCGRTGKYLIYLHPIGGEVQQIGDFGSKGAAVKIAKELAVRNRLAFSPQENVYYH